MAGCPPIDWLADGGVGFHDIIGKRYDSNRELGIVWYTRMDIRPGLFEDGFIQFQQSHIRSLAPTRYTLPYL